MSFLKGLGQCLVALTVLALFVGVILFFFTLVWMVRLVLLLVIVVAMIMYALSELFSGFRRKRRSS